MPQADFNVENQTFPAARLDINDQLLALASLNAGVSEPPSPVAYMLWPSLGDSLLKMRNGANTGWVTVGNLGTTRLGNAPLNSPAFTGDPTAQTHLTNDNSTKLATTAFVQAVVAAIPQAYPVGSIYLNAVNSTNPATLIGYGTWSRIAQGRFLVGLNEGDPDFNATGETGGQKAVGLTAANLPRVNIPFTRSPNGAIGSGSTDAFLYDNSSNTSNNNSALNFGNVSPTQVSTLPPYLTAYMWRRDA
jgi:hypothetical protein